MKKAPHLELIPLYKVDAFAGEPFSGNPAAVCFLMNERDEVWMQKVANEMNLSETAFFQLADDHFHLRWFTPETEVDLCGHATLATAHIIWETDLLGPDEEIVFATRSGRLRARKIGEVMELDFPAKKVVPCETPQDLEAIIGGKILGCYANGMDMLAEVETEEELLALKPQMERLSALPVRGLIVTCKGKGGKYDYLSRFFAPAVGVPEDPVTGSAHCALGPFWSDRLGRKVLHAYQASRRGGEITTEVAGERVLLRGKALTVMQGVVLV